MYNPEHILYFLAFATFVNLVFIAFVVDSDPATRSWYEGALCLVGVLPSGLGYIYSPLLFSKHPTIVIEVGRWILGVCSGMIVITLIMLIIISLQPGWHFWLKPKIDEWKEISGW